MRRNLLRKLIGPRALSAANRKTLLKFFNTIADYADRRNQLFHDLWTIDQTRKSVHRQKAGHVPKGVEDVFNEPLPHLIEFHNKLAIMNQNLSLAVLAIATDQPPPPKHRSKDTTRDRRKVD
jgi:hypothetical protein